MVEEFSKQYASILRSTQLPQEQEALDADIEDMLTRLDEFETLLKNVKDGIGSIQENELRDIMFFSGHFEDMCKKIDKLEIFVQSMMNSVDEMERATLLAEKTFNPTTNSFMKFLFNPLSN